jgi:uncharacterized protein
MVYTRYASHLRPAWIAALLAIEIFAWAHSLRSYCDDFLLNSTCQTIYVTHFRAISFLSVFALIVLARPNIRNLLCCEDRTTGVTLGWLSVQIVGFCLIMLPWALTLRRVSQEPINLALIPSLLGGCFAVLGAAFALASPGRWRAIIVELGPASLALLAASLLSPEIISADKNFFVRDLWYVQPLTQATFQSVVFVLKVFGLEATAKPTEWALSSNSFSILIAPGCSGVEGLALTTLFFGCYFYAFKEHLRFPNVWVLLPIGLLFSWALNVVRIAALFSIGMNGHRELAVSGFHTHAGWMAFSILAFAIIGVSTSVPWFWRGNTTPQPLLKDWTAARTLPFAAFMGAALLLSTFTVIPDLWYVVKVLAMTFALAAFLPVYRTRLFWRIDKLAVSAGIVIGLLWIAFGLTDSTALPLNTALASLPIGVWIGWVFVRLIGTIALVPVVEELMFRGYLLDRFSHNGGAARVIGLLLSTGLFAVMHERWALAGCAGLVYGLLYLRSFRVTDSIVAHSVSNAIIGFYALATAQWSLI